jgi:pimeloyl-ACP methyl ester carboxylesterase
MAAFTYQGHQITYDVHGSGERTLILIHGLLMNRRMYDWLGPEMAAHGNRVICVDLLGHGRSDRPEEMWQYSMTQFAEQVLGLMDHLSIDEAAVGGTSLGANVALELTAIAPTRVRALFIEMPVLDNALTAVALVFTPILTALRFGRPGFELAARLLRQVPRTNFIVDIGLDWLRQDPGPSVAVLEGLLLGRTAPHRSERRRFRQPALIVGHTRDPLHPFSDAGMLAEEMVNSRTVNATSPLEWRLKSSRLDGELARFLDDVWDQEAGEDFAGSAAAGAEG